MTDRVGHIDSLRGFAALSVVVFHLWQIAPGGQLELAWWFAPIQNTIGSAGVPLFFALSAYLLTSLMPKYEAVARPLATFYVRRIFRVVPLFYAALLFWVARRALEGGGTYSTPDIIWTLSLIFNLVPEYANTRPVFAGWTIGVEMLFYAIFPLIYGLSRSWIWTATALLISLVAAIAFVGVASTLAKDGVVPSNYQLLGFPRHLPVFLMGMLAFIAHERLKDHRHSVAIGLLLIAGSFVLLAGLASNNFSFAIDSRQWQNVAVALFLLGYLLCPLRSGIVFTSFIGRISYSIYLLHGPVIILMGGTFAWIYSWAGPADIAFPVCLAAALAAILPVSWVSYRLIELPGIHLGKMLCDRLNRSRSLQPAAPDQAAGPT